MATPKTIADYGGIKKNLEPPEDPETQVDSGEWNRMAEDAAQMTRTAAKAVVQFTTRASPGTCVVRGCTQWGNGGDALPVVTRTDTGKYAVTFSTSYIDALGEEEAVSLWDAEASLYHLSLTGSARATAAGDTATVYVYDGANVLSDLGGLATIRVVVR